VTGRRSTIAAMAVVALALSGCSIPLDDEPVILEGAGLPADAPAEEPADDAPEPTLVYLVEGDRLRAVPRPGQVSVVATVAVLLEGPRAAEVKVGLRSAIPAGTTVLGVSDEAGVTRVDLSEEFTAIVGEEALLALAQLIFTVTSSASSDRVAVSIEGEPIPVAREDGEVTSTPVGPDDYDELLGT
jgi:hypothetical protein